MEHPELDPVRVRLDLLRLARQLARHARELEPLALRAHVRERQVRVRDDRLLQVRLHARAAAAVGRDQLDLDARAVLLVASSIVVVASTTSGWFSLGVDAHLDL